MFMPVGTQASVKALSPDEVTAVGAQIILSNAYHLYLQPGVRMVRDLGGLHRFMAWPKPMLTDSGGFQAFSMGALRKIDDNGIRFRSHIDGSEHRFNPELAIINQITIGADIIMCLDQCISYGAPRDQVQEAMRRTHRWARECYQVFAASDAVGHPGLVWHRSRGSVHRPSGGIRGVYYLNAVPGVRHWWTGSGRVQRTDAARSPSGSRSGSPGDKPRYLMGVGSPEDLVEGVARGVDMFDCVLPTRVARNGALFTRQGRVDITKRRFSEVDRPLGRRL